MTSHESRWARMKVRAISVDGDRVAYRAAGKGPVLLLVHGMAGSSVTWRHVMPALAERFTVLAAHLLGQGRVAGGRGEPPRILSQPARGDRVQWAGGERPEPAVAGCAAADLDRVGGPRDPFIPMSHAVAAHEAIPGSRLEIFDGVGHYPHCEAPERFVEVLVDFIASTEPARLPPHSPPPLDAAAASD
jgi:pimeloyl-ACP methyl ester carboxylesterase